MKLDDLKAKAQKVEQLELLLSKHYATLLQMREILKDFKKKSFLKQALSIAKLVVLLISKIDELQQPEGKALAKIKSASDIQL